MIFTPDFTLAVGEVGLIGLQGGYVSSVLHVTSYGLEVGLKSCPIIAILFREGNFGTDFFHYTY